MIKVLVIDDSAFMRKMLSNMLNNDEEIEVMATARNGQHALDKLERINPDLITLDVEMPTMDGLACLRKIMEEKPLPVIMVSSLTKENSMTTIKALELGAVDFIPKPSGTISLDIDEIEEELVEKVKVAAGSKLDMSRIRKKARRKVEKKDKKRSRKVKARTKGQVESGKGVVIIGASTGGPRALKEVITEIDGDFGFGILLVQHMPPKFTTSLAKRLNRLSDLQVKEAKEGDKIEPGKVLLAPGDYHMLIDRNERISLNQEEKLHNVRPSIDPTMKSAVECYGSNIVGIVLTGMGRDGTQGLEAIKAAGGYTIAQNEETSVVYGMPKSAYEAGVVDSVKPLSLIGEEIMKYAQQLK